MSFYLQNAGGGTIILPMLTRIRATELPVEQFAADLYRTCGQFDIRPSADRRTMRGGVQVDRRAGIEVAHVAADLQQLVRSSRDIRQDAGENYFLILQEEGKALMSQNETSCLLSPGDMVLIDSACTSEFTFFGDYNRQLSLHLPRGEMHARFGYDLIRGGISVPRHDPTNLALCAVLGKVFGQPATNAASNSYLREAVFGLIGAMLHLACIIGGPDWYRALGAGEGIARAAERGKLQPHLMAAGIAAVLLVWVAYALAAAAVLPPLPLTKIAPIAITAVLLARGLLIFVPGLWRPDLDASFKFWSSLYVFAMAVPFAIGTVQRWRFL